MRLNIQLFAEGTINGSSTASNCDCRITWTSTSDVATNKSSVTANIQIYKSGSGSTTGTFSGSITINGSTKSVSKKFSPYNYGSWKTVGTYTVDVPHNTDGTKNCSISGSLTQTGTTMAGTYTASGTAILDTMPRASEITSVSAGTTDYNPSIVWTPYDSSFKFKIKYAYNGWSYTTGYITPNTTNPYTYNSYTITGSNVASYMSGEYGSFIIKLYTYDSSNNLIGESSKSFTVTLNSSYKPTTPFTTFGIAPYSTSVPTEWGIYVQGKSKANFRVDTNASTGSTIVAYSIKLDGYTYLAGPTAVSNIITSSGTLTVEGIATDSRGRSSSDTTHSIYVYPYSVPTFNTAQVYRCDANGNQTDEGTYVYYNFKGNVSSCNGNNKGTYKIAYKVSTASTYSNEITIASNQQSLNTSGILSSGGTPITFANTSSYDFKFSITDTFGTNTNTQTIDTGFDLMNFNASGKAMAIGKVSEAKSNEELLEVALPTEMQLGSYNSEGRNTSGETKYLNIINLTITRAYTDIPLIFNLSCRANHWARVFVKFSNQNTTDPTLAKFSYVCDNGCPLKPYILKTGTSNWSIYVYAVNNEAVSVTQLEYSPYIAERINITYPNVLVDTPTGGYEAEYEQIQIRQVYKEKSDTSAGQNFHLLGATGENEGMSRPLTTNGAYIWAKSGTTTIDGESGLVLGNSTATGTDGNRRGGLRLYSPNTGSNYLYPRGHTSTYTSYLPMKSGDLLVQPKRLYYDATGTSGNVTLSETSANYTYLEIFYRYSDNATRGSVKLHSPNGRKFQITANYDNGTYLYSVLGNYSVSETTITVDSQIRWRFRTDGNATRTTGVTNIYIYRVDGIWVRNDAQ